MSSPIDTRPPSDTLSIAGSARTIIVATPCFGGQVTSQYAAALLALQNAAANKGIGFRVLMLGGDALITRARANLVAHFLDDPGATHLLFIDADIGFSPDQVFRLLDFDVPMAAAAYPIKRIDWPKLAATLAEKRAKPESAALHYVAEFMPPDRVAVRDGFATVRYAGTGFLMIQRSALHQMIAAYPDLRFQGQHGGPDPLARSPHRYALFECLIDPATGTYLSEDFSFCRRWTDLGGAIWLDLGSCLDHVGPIVFQGNLATQFAPVNDTP